MSLAMYGFQNFQGILQVHQPIVYLIQEIEVEGWVETFLKQVQETTFFF
jgi:hypothetical protein